MNEVFYLDRVEARWSLRFHLEPGSRVPLHCTASGKLFLANMAPAKRARALDSLELTAFTIHTVTDRADLEADLSEIAACGYSLDREEFLMGLSAVAVPISSAKGEVIAALACHTPSTRLGPDVIARAIYRSFALLQTGSPPPCPNEQTPTSTAPCGRLSGKLLTPLLYPSCGVSRGCPR
ncbi:MAG TPA: IclR family transcriptional regulator C-terminal domain-containing protein [Rhizobiaceae bacterium]|nr:IclR family transcriptional regulator C-terminal domain-containing protein [Rhizobiaceae bacterium]